MKKVFSILMVALLATLSLSSCKKDNSGQGGDDPTAKKIARITKLGDYKFSYNANGTVSSVVEDWGDGSYALNFVYNGTSININDSEGTVYKVTLNDKGLASKVEIVGDATFTYTYDANGFCIDCKKDGKDQCQQSIDDLCVMYWTRAAKNDDGTVDHWRHKDHTYLSKDNLGDLHPEWAEDFGQKRWFYETGLLGRGSSKLMSTAQWDDAEKIAKYEYVYDANGLVTKETKNYGMPGALEFDTEYVIEWELLK